MLIGTIASYKLSYIFLNNTDGSLSRFLDPEEAAFGRKDDGPI